jgi:hypothetical protein
MEPSSTTRLKRSIRLKSAFVPRTFLSKSSPTQIVFAERRTVTRISPRSSPSSVPGSEMATCTYS